MTLSGNATGGSRTITDEVAAEAERILSTLSLDEKLWMLDGDTEFWDGLIGMSTVGYNRTPYVAGSLPAHGIDGIRFSDGPRGVVMGSATCFPVAMARGASFDPALEEAIGDAIGTEVRALGGNLFAGVCVNLLRHPAWGRAQETYGEDPTHLGEMGAALTRGVQKHVMACVKHFALNSMENARFQVDVTCDEDTLQAVYLPHFRRIVEEGVASVMSAYNSLNGEWCGQNPELLQRILRQEWGFDGFVMTDFLFGMRDSANAINAGQDLEMPVRMIHAAELAGNVANGAVSLDVVNTACKRLLSQQIRFRTVARTSTSDYSDAVVACDAHRELARRAAAESMVLLQNRGVLPVNEAVRRLAVIGSLADIENIGDGGSSRVRPPYVVTPLAGIRSAFEPRGVEVRFNTGSSIDAACELAQSCDLAVVLVGYTHEDEGEFVGLGGPDELKKKFPPQPDHISELLAERRREKGTGKPSKPSEDFSVGGDRTSLRLHAHDDQLIAALAASGTPAVVVVECSSAVLMEEWRTRADAILVAWYPGMEGGHALADVLSGAVNPSGHLPFVIPTSEAHLPPFDRNATSITYGPLHGQWLVDSIGVSAAFPFGFGLSYTTFEIVRAQMSGDVVQVVTRNVGLVDGACVVQIYESQSKAHSESRSGSRSISKLAGFAKTTIPANSETVIEVPLFRLVSGELNAGLYAGDPFALPVEG